MSPGPRTAFVVLLAAIAPAAACHPPRARGPTTTVVHPNGLALALPETLGGRRISVDRTPTGFAVRLEPRNARTATSTLVTFEAGVSTPAGVWPKTRTVRGATIRYSLETFPDDFVGSGGPEYELRAWEPARSGHVAYVQHAQTEGEPDFTLIWAVVEGARPPP